MKKCSLLLFFVFEMFALIPITSAFYDTFQTHPNDNLTQAEEAYGVIWSTRADYRCCVCDAHADIHTQNDGIKYVWISPSYGGYDHLYAWIRQTAPKEQSNHWIFLLKASCADGYEFKFKFYNQSGGLIGESNNLLSWLQTYGNSWKVWELVRSGTQIYCYINGTYIGDIGGSYEEPPCFIEFYTHNPPHDWTGGCCDVFVDFVGTYTGEGVIETFPHNWYILRHWDTSEASGLYDESDTKIHDNQFSVNYIVPYIATDPCDKIQIKHFTTGEIVNETIISNRYRTIYYNFTKMLFHQNKEDDKYGYYFVELIRGGSVVARDYFYFTWDALNKPSGTIAWDKDCYTSGEVAKVHTNLTDPDFSTYVYKGYVYDVYGNKKEEWTITSADEWHEVNLNGYNAGVYYAILKIRDKNTGFEWEEAWDVTSVSEEVRIEGVSYDAKSETVLGGVYVNAIQNYESHETTTDATTGAYNISGLTVDMEIQMNASKANYTHNNFSFTPLQNGLYEVNLYLLPDASHINVTAPAIVGLTQSYPFHQNVSYATVNIWNETGWNASITANSMGYFAFEKLSPGIYYLNATREGYKSSETYEVNLTGGEIEYVYILMYGLYNLTVKARDASTHATIFNFKATLNDGEQTKETTSGWLNFTGVEYGIHKVEVGADGYYSAIEYVYVYGDVEKIVYLTPLETAGEQGVGISYPPHQVEFACVDMFGNPLADIYVEATPISTTTGTWDWLLNLFGIRNESISYYINQTLNGTTDSRGAITFVMMENVEYEVNFRNESLGINKTIRIYPKADHYTVILTPTTPSIVSSEDYITFCLLYTSPSPRDRG